MMYRGCCQMPGINSVREFVKFAATSQLCWQGTVDFQWCHLFDVPLNTLAICFKSLG